MLALLTCSTSRFEDYDDADDFKHAVPVRRQRSTKKSASTKGKRRKVANMVIGSPTGFRHDVHLGRDLKADKSYMLWDVERWREELAKRDLILPPIKISEPPAIPSTPMTPNCSKRSSFTPQKRKPVPSLVPVVPCLPQPSPHEVPLPPSPATPTVTDSESIPPLDSPSREPSIDEDGISLPESVEKVWGEIHMRKAAVDPAVELHTDGSTLQLQ